MGFSSLFFRQENSLQSYSKSNFKITLWLKATFAEENTSPNHSLITCLLPKQSNNKRCIFGLFAVLYFLWKALSCICDRLTSLSSRANQKKQSAKSFTLSRISFCWGNLPVQEDDKRFSQRCCLEYTRAPKDDNILLKCTNEFNH